MPLVIYGLRGGDTHTHTQTHTHTYFGGMKVISRNQVPAGLHASDLKTTFNTILLHDNLRTP